MVEINERELNREEYKSLLMSEAMKSFNENIRTEICYKYIYNVCNKLMEEQIADSPYAPGYLKEIVNYMYENNFDSTFKDAYNYIINQAQKEL